MSARRDASGSNTPLAGPSREKKEIIDPYRTLSNALSKPLNHLIPASAKSESPSLAGLFNLNDQVMKARLEGKNITLDDSLQHVSSSLVQGRKRNQGDPQSKAAARDAAQRKGAELRGRGLTGMRKVRKRLAGVQPDDRISYESLLPLHHLHITYLCSLLSLPPLPSPVPPIPPLTGLPPGVTMEGISSKLIKADFTGMEITVSASRNPSLEGLKGIIIEETAATVRIVGADDRVRVVPKSGTQFGLSFPAYAPARAAARGTSARATSYGDGEAEGGGEGEGEIGGGTDMPHHLATSPRLELTLLGSNFTYRSADRAGRRFRLAQGEGGNGWGEEWVKGEWEGVLDLLPSNGGKRKERDGPVIGEREKEKGLGGAGMRKKGKSRRKDPVAGGSREVVF